MCTSIALTGSDPFLYLPFPPHPTHPFDLDMDGFDHQMQPTVSSSLNNLDFNSSPFESSISEWGSMELGLQDLL